MVLASWQGGLVVVFALLVGLALGWLWATLRGKQWQQQSLLLEQQLQQQQQATQTVEQRLQQREQSYQQLQHEQQTLQQQLTAAEIRLSEGMRNAEEKLKLVQDSEERMKKEFERLAQQVFEQKSVRLQQTSQQSLEATLAPFKQQLDAFKQQVTTQHTEELKQREQLSTQVSMLRQLNQQMAAEAEALTRALKGDNKAQGNWGEVVLERILQQSGLREGAEYDTQSHHRDDEGRSLKPDVIVHLPHEKDVVIDSKVSLVAYERYFNSSDDEQREQALQEHVSSLRAHIKGLSKKNYQQLSSVRTLDYVLLFIPIEPAFLLAVDRDPELIGMALEHNIMLVSPTNLMVALRTVYNIWQYEYQNQNAQKIAADAAKLYDKFVGFVEDLQKLGNSLDTVRKHYDGALNKLSTGRGSLVSRVEHFRKMGVQTGKKLDPQLLHQVDDDSDDEQQDSASAD